MTQPTTSRGRPAIPETILIDKIHNAAITLLLEKGHEAFTMNELAAAASVAKKTIYRFYPDKHAVLDKIFAIWTDSQTHPQLNKVTTRQEAINELESFFTQLASEVLNPLSIGIFKYLQADHPDKQQLLEYYQRHGIGLVSEQLNIWFQALKKANLLTTNCPDAPARYLQSLIIAPLLRDIALGVLPTVPTLDVQPLIKRDLKFIAPLLFK
ncbi:TetR/AcrR family transcriptional regulator [Celerinatantimonas sp. MCCC 1A17872]|uniref:TetR/AcrR family transcriptional regulator n=1 Tax=Celerinatantimonas sp. MCCC 1A17872 TaxID=3177514 RepID=UPI0038CB1E24